VTNLVKDLYLIEEVKKGNTNAFKTLVEKYEKSISNIVIGMLGYTPEAEEIAQDVFLKFYMNCSKFRNEASLKTYLSRIAINLSLNELKRRKKQRERYVYDEEIKNNSEAKTEDDFELKEIIEKALMAIKPDLRAVVILRLIEGYDTKETAKILKIPAGTVLSRLSRAQEKLRPLLKEGKYN
jgi:RNA polymerase sigma-70 factor (ECF subfamily)